jgi:hypothetical protein
MSKHNLERLVEAARLLRPLLGELVFVGGSTTALFITDKAAAEVRSTYDVDAIADIGSYAAYAEFSERLRQLTVAVGDGRDAQPCVLCECSSNQWNRCAKFCDFKHSPDGSRRCLTQDEMSACRHLCR